MSNAALSDGMVTLTILLLIIGVYLPVILRSFYIPSS